MHPATIAAAFGAIFLAELPDKTMLATIVLSARYRRPLAVWVGAATALTAQMVIAVAAGRLLDLLPDRLVRLLVAALFGTGAVLLWRSADEPSAELDDAAIPGDDVWRRLPSRRVSLTVLGVVFLAEWGDLTQLATASLAADGEALSVFTGATAAMITVAAIGVVAGQSLLRVLPERALRRVASLVFAALAVLALVAAIRG